MFRRFRNFVARHPKKVAAVSVIVVGSLAWKYAKRRFEEWQEQEGRKLLDAARRQQHFEAIASTADTAMIALGPSIAKSVHSALDTTVVVAKLQELRDKRGQEWRAAWTELKELVIARVIALIYSQALLCVLLRVQIAALAGKMFRQSQDELTQSIPALDESQLATCQSLINSGVPSICRVVCSAVSRSPMVADAGLGQRLTLPNLEKLLWSVQTILCENPTDDPLRNIASLTHEESSELSELLGSDEVWSLASSCVSKGLAHTVDSVACFFSDFEPEAGSSTSNHTMPTVLCIPLAKIIPILDGICRKAAHDQNGSSSNVDFLKLLANDDKLKTLSANIYESFGDTDQNHNPRASRGLL